RRADRRLADRVEADRKQGKGAALAKQADEFEAGNSDLEPEYASGRSNGRAGEFGVRAGPLTNRLNDRGNAIEDAVEERHERRTNRDIQPFDRRVPAIEDALSRFQTPGEILIDHAARAHRLIANALVLSKPL